MKAIVILLTISLVLSSSASRLTAQPAPDEGKLAVLVDGLGSYSRPISTKSELAQKFFDQGLRLVYAYYSPEATASFTVSTTPR